MGDKDFFYAFGILTVSFANMEAKLRKLITGIAFGENSVAASAFLDSSQLTHNIRILKKLARNYWNKENLFLEIVRSVEQIRETRNLFIHGLWHPNNFGNPNGFAIVTDLRTFFDRKDNERTWHHGKTQNYSDRDFQEILDSINTINKKIEYLCELVESEEGISLGLRGITASCKPVTVHIG